MQLYSVYDPTAILTLPPSAPASGSPASSVSCMLENEWAMKFHHSVTFVAYFRGRKAKHQMKSLQVPDLYRLYDQVAVDD